MKYLAVLGRQPEISILELEMTNFCIDIDRLGGTQKLAVELGISPIEYLRGLPEGKITIGVSDYSERASRKTATSEALKLKKILVRHGRSVRVVENKEAVLSTATSLHNGLSGKNERKVELIKVGDGWYKVIGVQDIEAYAKRDQARPARDARVGMLPPKLAQILINLCGPLKENSVVLDPFCGTGVVLQEALLMGYKAYGTDINKRMIEYSVRNLKWLTEEYMLSGDGVATARRYGGRAPRYLDQRSSAGRRFDTESELSVYSAPTAVGRNLRSAPESSIPSVSLFQVQVGDATSFQWDKPIDAVACEGYLGKPMSKIPTEMELKTQKQECGAIVIGFLKNLYSQIEPGTPVVIAVPAWLREGGKYERLEIVDNISDMGYNVNNKTREGLLYSREGQIVARDILILRKK